MNTRVLIHEIVEFAAAESPHGLALVAGDFRWTFTELLQDVQRFAAGIAELTDPSDRVVIISDNCPVMLIALYAVPAAGAVATLGNTRHSVPELVAMIQATEPTVILASSEQLDRLATELPNCQSVRHVICMNGTHPTASAQAAAELGLSPASEDEINSTRSGAAAKLQAVKTTDLDPASAAWLIHTSGTTGRAKGALLSHRGLLAAIQNTALARPVSADDVYLFPFPLFHVAAYNVLHVHLRRRPVVLIPRFEAGEVLRLIKNHRVTTCSLAPTML